MWIAHLSGAMIFGSTVCQTFNTCNLLALLIPGTRIYPVFANSVAPDQLASEAN